MQCPNCSNQIPDNSSKCGVCGISIHTLAAPVETGFPGWVKGLLIGGGIGLIFFILLGGGAFLFYQKFAQPLPPPTQIATIVEPTQIIAPTATEVLIEHPSQEAPTPTTEPTQLPTPTIEVQHCDAFDGVKMSVVYMDWYSNEPLEFYIKMPGGVPGLEKEIPDAVGEWNYGVKIGIYNSIGCEVIAGYKERLYCKITLPSEYESAVQPMYLFVNQCDENVFSEQSAFLPEIKKK